MEEEESAKKARIDTAIAGHLSSVGMGGGQALETCQPRASAMMEHPLEGGDMAKQRAMGIVPGSGIQEVMVHGRKRLVDWVDELKGSTSIEVYTPRKSIHHNPATAPQGLQRADEALELEKSLTAMARNV